MREAGGSGWTEILNPDITDEGLLPDNVGKAG